MSKKCFSLFNCLENIKRTFTNIITNYSQFTYEHLNNKATAVINFSWYDFNILEINKLATVVFIQ